MGQNNDAAIQARREYQRRWRAANKDKVRRYNEAFWRKQARKLDEAEGGEEHETEDHG